MRCEDDSVLTSSVYVAANVFDTVCTRESISNVRSKGHNTIDAQLLETPLKLGPLGQKIFGCWINLVAASRTQKWAVNDIGKMKFARNTFEGPLNERYIPSARCGWIKRRMRCAGLAILLATRPQKKNLHSAPSAGS